MTSSGVQSYGIQQHALRHLVRDERCDCRFLDGTESAAEECQHRDVPQLHLAGDYEYGKNRSYEKAGEQHELRERAPVDAVCHQAAKGGYD